MLKRFARLLRLRPVQPPPAPASAAYRTPGVSIEEIPAQPANISAVRTDVPVFVGITEAGGAPARIASFEEFEAIYGGPPAMPIRVELGPGVDPSSPTLSVRWQEVPAYPLHASLRHYFANGGGACHVIPVGQYGDLAGRPDFESGLDAFDGIAEATLVLFPDALALPAEDYSALCGDALRRCAERRNTFLLADLPGPADRDTAEAFFGGLSGDLTFGAVYAPFLETVYAPAFADEDVLIGDLPQTGDAVTLAALRMTDPVLSGAIDEALAGLRLVLPATPAVAGAICRNDRERGVWKAPANIALADTSAPLTAPGETEPADLANLLPHGLSVNPIRAFDGRGIVVWGARTMAGSDAEFRYVSVRRFSGMIEVSLEKSLGWVVFEPNDERTWRRAKAAVENFLFGLWRSGALAGAKPEQAFYVAVGTGRTMTAQDVLEGRLVVEIGIAALRPAEFLVQRHVFRMADG